MKKVLFFTFSLFPFLAHAQRPVEGAQGFTFGISGLQNIGVNTAASRTGTLLYRKYKTDSMAYRISAGLTILTNRTSLESKDLGIRTITMNNTMAINLAPGFQQSLGGNSRLEPYWGLDFLIGYTFTNSQIERTEVINADTTSDPDDQLGDYKETETRIGSPFRIGAFPLVGANYFVTDNVAFGVEFSYGLVASFSKNGTRIFRDRIAGVDQEEKAVNISASNTSFGTTGSTVITISIFF
jgi:hypothetical protein